MGATSIHYVLSDQFPYGATFYEDSGPPFAADYGWPTCKLSSIRDLDSDVFVLDDRILPSEIPFLKSAIESSTALFLIKLCDPGLEHASGHWWYQFSTMLMDTRNVHFLINYHPVEWTARFFVKASRSRFIWAPYLYFPERERTIDHASRSGTFIVSSVLNPKLYPLRNRISAMSRIPPMLFITEHLPHPGYRNRSHNIVGSAYVDKLSNFRYGAVCSSRCRVELLKYREFAYAGIVPVGDLPITLLDCPREAWLPWRMNPFAMAAVMRRREESQRNAETYRSFMRKSRNADTLRRRVNDAIGAL